MQFSAAQLTTSDHHVPANLLLFAAFFQNANYYRCEEYQSRSLSLDLFHSNKGGKVLKKLWCCVGGKYNKIIWFALTNSVAPSFCKPHTTHNSSIRFNKGLTLETSAFESLYVGQFTLSTQLTKPNYLVIPALQ